MHRNSLNEWIDRFHGFWNETNEMKGNFNGM